MAGALKIKSGDVFLTEKQRSFVRNVGAGHEPERAALMAGYQNHESAYANMRLPAIQAAIDIELRRLLVTEAAPLALAFLIKVVKDDSTRFSDRVRVDAAKTLLSRAGYNEPKQVDQARDKAVEEMSTAELHAFIDRTEAELASRATDVSAPIQPTLDSQLSDLL
jgi:hypothetical protein